MNFNLKSIFKRTKKEPKEIKKLSLPDVQVQEFYYHIKNDLKVTYPLRPGDEVISVSNNIDGVSRGTLLRFTRITMAKNIVPIVRYENDETEYICMGTLIPFDDEMYDTLKELESRGDSSAWNYVSPSWCQIDGEKFREKKNSIRKEIREL